MGETLPIHHQLQLSELSKVVECYCSSGLNARGLGKDAVLMTSAGRGYSQRSRAVSLRNLTVLALI